MKKKYIVFAGLYEDSNEGWIWIPPEKSFTSRDYITISTTSNEKKVNCICRIIDNNLLYRYNQPPRNHVEDVNSTIVITDYYRNRLGALNTGKEYEFEIVRIGKLNYYGKIKALCQHPDNIVKVATWLAIISISIGVISILSSILSVYLN